MILRLGQFARGSLQRMLTGPSIKALVVTVSLWVTIWLYCRHTLWRYPHGKYFQGEHVNDLVYSKYMDDVGRKHVASANTTNASGSAVSGPGIDQDGKVQQFAKARSDPLLCASFVTIRRDKKQYFEPAIGSMLAGLYPEERAALNLSILFADTDPTKHPDWNSPWVANLIDDANTYQNVPKDRWEEIKKAEKDKNYYIKGVLYVITTTLLALSRAALFVQAILEFFYFFVKTSIIGESLWDKSKLTHISLVIIYT
jgi:hypothetical protein